MLVEIVADHVGHEGIDDLVVRHPGAGRVRQCDVPACPRTHEARHADQGLGIERLRVEEQVVDAPVDDVDPLGAVDRAHVAAVVVGDEQIGALHQLHARLPREIGMLEIGGVVDAGRQQHDERHLARPGREARERLVQLGRIVVDRQDGRRLEQLGEDSLGHHPVLDHVRDAGRHAQVVLEHVERAVAVAHEIRAADVRPHAAFRLHARALRPVVPRIGQQLLRKDAVLDDLLIGVDVLDEAVERHHALLQSRLGPFPLRPRDDAREDVEGPGPVDVSTVRIDREGDAHRLDRQLGGEAPRRELRGGETGQVLHQRTGRGPRLSRFLQELVERGRTVESPVHGGGLQTPRRSSVEGCSGSTRGGVAAYAPGVWPIGSKRESRRDSASRAFTGNAS